jgi:hypothetical protein
VDFLKNLVHDVTKGASVLANIVGHPIDSIANAAHSYDGQAERTPLTPAQASAYKPITSPNDPTLAMKNSWLAGELAKPRFAVMPTSHWQQGALPVEAPIANPGGAYVSPFDTDTQALDPMQQGQRQIVRTLIGR